MNNIAQWAEFGVLGLVIASLFGVVIIGFKLFMTFIQKQHDNHRELFIQHKKQQSQDLRYLHDQHREERAEWYKEEEKRTLRYEASFRELSGVIKELTRRN